jgi:hypothetical protein
MLCAFFFSSQNAAVRFPPASVLATATESTAFVLLLWQELFGEDTPDTYQPRLQNLPALVEELHEVAKLATSTSQWAVHLKEIKAELQHATTEVGFLLGRLSKYEWLLNDLVTFDDPSQIVRAASLAMQDQPSFEEFYETGLCDAVKKLPVEKKDASRALGNLASYAIRTGRSRESFLSRP